MTVAVELLFPTVFPVLETERLVLREVTETDADALFQIHSDPETMRYWSGPPWRDRSKATELLARAAQGYAEQARIRWGYTRRGDDTLIGVANLHAIDAQSRRGELGYILHRAHWGHGYNHEALTRIVDWAFAELGLHRLEAELDPRNEGSARAVERLGFVREGLLRERWIVEGEVSDSLMVGLLRAEWRAR
ncbi:MAG: GNAT family protein [Gaiellales bacterium]